MAPSRQWDDEESDSSSYASSSVASNAKPVTTSQPDTAAQPVTTSRRRQFEDEEDDSDVLDSWDAAEDSEVEREKTRKAEEVKTKLAADAAAKKKSKLQRIADHQAERTQLRLDDDSSSEEDETESERRQRLRRTEQEADLHHAEDLFGAVGVSHGRKALAPVATITVDPKDPTSTVDLSSLPLFNPHTKMQFEQLRSTMVPIIGNCNKKAHYTLFLQEFVKQLARDLPSDQIKKISSSLTTLSNEKMKEEKAADKGGKKSKAAKTKSSLVAARAPVADVATYDDAFGEDDFM